MLSLRTMAQVYRLGLLTGIFNKQDVINWADRLIETLTVEEIPSGILDVSLAGRKSIGEIVSMLNGVPGEYEFGLATKIVLGLLRRKYVTEPSCVGEIMTILYDLSGKSHELDDSTYSDIMMVTEAYDMAVERIVSMQDTLDLIDKFFASFKPYEDVLHDL